MAQAQMKEFFERKIGARFTRTILSGEVQSHLESGRRFTVEIWAVDAIGVHLNATSYAVTPMGDGDDISRTRLHYGDWLLAWKELAGLEAFWVALLDRIAPSYILHLKNQVD